MFHEPKHLKMKKGAKIMSIISLVTSAIFNQLFPSKSMTYIVGYFFHLLLICISKLECCENTGWDNIECRLFSLHQWIIIYESNKPEWRKHQHRIIDMFYFSASGDLKNNIGANVIVWNIRCNFFDFELIICQWKANIYCWLFLPPLSSLYH